VLAAERREPFRILERPWVGKLPLYLSGSGERLREAIAEAQACLPYFCRKRSMRPAVSTSFCLPVKNGWHAEQMSVWISAWVERVSNVLPHAQLTVAVA
jgi:hypothetical protein